MIIHDLLNEKKTYIIFRYQMNTNLFPLIFRFLFNLNILLLTNLDLVIQPQKDNNKGAGRTDERYTFPIFPQCARQPASDRRTFDRYLITGTFICAY